MAVRVTTSMLEAIESRERSSDATLRQYARHCRDMLHLAGCSDEELSRMEARLETYLLMAPKYDKRSAGIARIIASQNWKPSTYRQYQSDGRRLLEHVTGEMAARQALQRRKDSWARLQEAMTSLANAGFSDMKNGLKRMSKLRSLARADDIETHDIDRHYVESLRGVVDNADAWREVKRAANILDELRGLLTFRDLLPDGPIGEITTPWRKKREVPEHLDVQILDWVARATVTLPENVATPEAHVALATEHSDGAKGIYLAGMRAFVAGIGEFQDLRGTNSLAGLFSKSNIERLLAAWNSAHLAESPARLKPRSVYCYTRAVRLTLERNGQDTAVTSILSLAALPVLKEGKRANEFMSEKTETWCRDLLDDPVRSATFEMQHVRYFEKAKAALKDAMDKGFDLRELSDPEKMKRIPRRKRSQATSLLRRARMFGVCAAFAAIELEGAPFRRENTLDLEMAGQKQTFFNHTKGSDPYFRIVLPNEMLKNGEALAKRGTSLPPIDIRKEGPGDLGLEILKCFLKQIRPLFPGHRMSSALFPGIEAGDRRLVTSTFDGWLIECSTEINLPMTAHNFRHGVCSLEIREDPNCYEQLADFLGDRPNTIRKYYAFVNRQKTLRDTQKRRSERRAKLRRSASLKKAA